MTSDLLHRPELSLLAALAIGLLIGAERERRKGEGETRRPAGVRTFAVTGLLGGVCALLGAPMSLLGAGPITLVAIAGYILRDRRDPGLTGEVALLATDVLGALAVTRPLLALEVGVVVATLLAYRVQIHRLVRETLTEQELLDGIAFAIAAVVVLPLLPNRPLDPFDLLNPFRLWRLVVVLMSLSAVGYAAQRLVGVRFGLVAAGLAGGLVSATAAVAAMAQRSKADAAVAGAAAGGAVASLLSSVAYMIALIAAVNPDLLPPLALPLGAAATATLIYAAVLGWRVRPGSGPIDAGRAFNFGAALLFVAIVAGFTVLGRLMTTYLGAAGALASAAATGLVDAHAAAVSMATLNDSGRLDTATAALAILVGLTVNMLVKAPVAFAMGAPSFARRVSLGVVIMLAVLWAAYAVTRLGF